MTGESVSNSTETLESNVTSALRVTTWVKGTSAFLVGFFGIVLKFDSICRKLGEPWL